MPLNRFITFVKPYINLAAGAIAAWLIAKANVLGIPGLGEHGNELQIGIAAALAWGVTQLATQMGDLKWLKGHHLALIAEAGVTSAAVQAAAALPDVGIDAEPVAIMTLDEELPSDDEEFAAPPPDETNVPIQPSQFDAEPVPA
jgi:ABC-type Co2+ transport system permease subunit